MTDVVSLTGGRPGVDAEARDWVLRLMDRTDDSALSEACSIWRDADPSHEAAFWQAWRVWGALGGLPAVMSDDWRLEAEQLRVQPLGLFHRVNSRWAAFFGVAAMVAAILLVFATTWPAGVKVTTKVAEMKVVALNDGSRVTVGGRSGIEAFVDKKFRRVRLDHGQAFFEVAHDPAHPFVVIAGDAEITVRGTKFDVRHSGDDVQVNVLEGRVEVRRRGTLSFISGGRPDAVITAGQRSELKPAASSFVPAEPAPVEAGEWRGGRLFYADAPLSLIIADAQRYSNVRFKLASGLSDQSLTVSYRAGDVDGLISSINAALPLRATRRDGEVLILPNE